MKRPLRESDIEKYLVKRVKELGGECRKIQFIGRPGAPDRLVMLPERAGGGLYSFSELPAATIWIELKAPGKKAEPHQLREHARMRKMGQRVEVVDNYARVDEILA
jgi:hypothetical protein